MKWVGSLILVGLVGCGGVNGSSTGKLPPQAPPPNAVGGFHVELPAMTLQPGDERTP